MRNYSHFSDWIKKKSVTLLNLFSAEKFVFYGNRSKSFTHTEKLTFRIMSLKKHELI